MEYWRNEVMEYWDKARENQKDILFICFRVVAFPSLPHCSITPVLHYFSTPSIHHSGEADRFEFKGRIDVSHSSA
jgi:hypothetical protein